jgi:hypothetical protein
MARLRPFVVGLLAVLTAVTGATTLLVTPPASAAPP